MLDPLRFLPRLSMFMSRSCELNTVLRCSRKQGKRYIHHRTQLRCVTCFCADAGLVLGAQEGRKPAPFKGHHKKTPAREINIRAALELELFSHSAAQIKGPGVTRATLGAKPGPTAVTAPHPVRSGLPHRSGRGHGPHGPGRSPARGVLRGPGMLLRWRAAGRGHGVPIPGRG